MDTQSNRGVLLSIIRSIMPSVAWQEPREAPGTEARPLSLTRLRTGEMSEKDRPATEAADGVIPAA
jgi:hypothetical protein